MFADPRLRRYGTATLVGASAVLTAVAVGVLVWDSFRGYDISDEGFYLYAADPANKASTANGVWGMYIGLLYRAVGYSLPGFRIAGIALLLGCAVWFGVKASLLIESITDHPLGRAGRAAVLVMSVAASLLYYGLVILTPSYNWLALCGILLALGGLFGILAGRTGGWSAIGYVAAISAGCFLTFWGRNIAGAGLWILIQLTIAGLADATRPQRLRLVAGGIAGLMILAVIHASFLLGFAPTFAALGRARDFNFDGHFATPLHTMASDALDDTLYAPHRVVSVANGWLLLGLAPLLALAMPGQRRVGGAATLAAAAVGLTGIALVLSHMFDGGVGSYKTVSPAVLALIVVAGLAWLSAKWVRRRCAAGGPTALRRSRATLVVLALLLPITAAMFAFTSKNAFLGQTSLAAVLGFGSALFVVVAAVGSARARLAALSLALVASSAAVASAVSGAGAPYLAPPLHTATVRAAIDRRGSEVLLTSAEAAYFRDLVGPAEGAGFVPGTPLIDLTRFNPGAAVALGAAAPSTLVFGYTAYTARWVLARQNRARWRDAWVLIRLTGERRIDPKQVLKVLGRSFPADYVPVTTAVWPHGHQVHQLWRPRTP